MNKRELLKKIKLSKYFYSIKRILFKDKKSSKLIVDNTKIDSIGNNPKKVKVRNPGVDMARIASMYSIIIHHVLIHGEAFYIYSKYTELDLMNITTSFHVTTLGLISGYIGYKSNKYSNLFYLWFWVEFYSLSITFFLNKFRPELETVKFNYTYFFPVIFGKYWYFTKYLGMYLFLPVINKGISLLTKSELRNVFMSLICILIIERDIVNPIGDEFKVGDGFSCIWLLICFIMGAYFGKFKHNYQGFKKFIFCILYLNIFYYSTYFCYKITFYPKKNVSGYFKQKVLTYLKRIFVRRINSIPMILQSISVLLFLTQIKYNKYLAKIIIFIGPLTFGVYLIHEHPLIRRTLIRNLFSKDSKKLPVNSVVKLILIRALKIFSITACIDYLRYLLFTLLRIRKICIFIEEMIFN